MDPAPTPAGKRPFKPILCLDFDGVLHWYRHGFSEPLVIDDEPVPGAVEFVRRAQRSFRVIVYSSRSRYPGGIEAMRSWMDKNGFPPVDFATEKPAAWITIDDRALTFRGEWFDMDELLNFRPWNR